MKEEKFKIIQYIRELIINIDNNLDNFPKKDIELKNRIRNISYDLLELAYEANTVADKDKKIELLYKLVAKLKVTDFLINLCYDKQIINQKRYIKFGARIDDISKFTAGWIKTIQGIYDRWVASRSVNVNSEGANFNAANVENGNVNSNNNNLCNSDASGGNDNEDSNSMAFRPVASTNCGYINIVYVRDNVETVYVHQQML